MDLMSERFAALLSTSAALIAVYDEDDRLRFANDAFRSAFALTAEETPLWSELMRRNTLAGLGTVIRSPDFESWLVSAQSRRGKIPFRSFETDLVDGRWLWMNETVEENGWMLCVASDITHIRTSERNLRQDRDFALRASQTDELTSISNRRFMMAALDELVRRQAGARPMMSCACIIDLDFFKCINDRFGHQTGDDVLIDFARRVHMLVRRHDSFGRIGGEEFMLLMPDTDLAEGEAIIGRVLQTVRQARPIVSDPSFSYTCSAGLVQLRAGETTREIYSRADAALYVAKRAGRDQLKSVA